MIKKRVHEQWAHLRFSVIGQLLAAPPEKGALRAELAALSAREWRHPTTGEPVHFGASTIERWYYRALKERQDPVGVLRRKVRQDAGQQASMGEPLRRAVLSLYAGHKSWSVRLHHANLIALGREESRAETGAVLRHAATLLQGAWPGEAASAHFAADRGRPHGRSAAGRA